MWPLILGDSIVKQIKELIGPKLSQTKNAPKMADIWGRKREQNQSRQSKKPERVATKNLYDLLWYIIGIMGKISV